MAILFSRSVPGSGWVLSLKVLLASTTVLSMAVVMRTSVVPVIADFVVSEAPTSVYGSVLSWLRPPYLYVLINCIIISIVASSKLQSKLEEDEARAPPASPAVPIPAEPIKVSGDVTADYAPARGGVPDWSGDFGDEKSGKVDVVDGDVFGGAEDGALDRGAEEVNGDEEAEVLKPVKLPERNDSTDFSFLNSNDEEAKVKKKKSPVSARLPPRRSAKSNPEGGKALGVSKQKRNDTLESTWKAITDGRAMPLARHLRKSDTWDNRLRRNDENTLPVPAPRMKKSETFADRSDTAVRSPSPSTGSGKLRREPSLGQEELNRRVEAFISKFNEEMRLQRQESLNRYQEMVRRGAV